MFGNTMNCVYWRRFIKKGIEEAMKMTHGTVDVSDIPNLYVCFVSRIRLKERVSIHQIQEFTAVYVR